MIRRSHRLLQLAVLAGTTSLAGMYITKDVDPNPPEETLLAQQFEQMTDELKAMTAEVTKTKEEMDKQYKDLSTHFNGQLGDEGEMTAKVKEQTAVYAELAEKHQKLVATVDQIKKELEAPAFRKGDDKKEFDTSMSVELQRRAYIAKGGDPELFKADMDNLVDMDTYRSIARKFMRVGIDSKEKIRASLSEVQTKAFEAASLDIAFFSPEMLGLEVDCNIECAEIWDLYGQESVSRSQFMYPRVNDYGQIGEYTCDAECDGPLGEEGNIQFLQGQTYDYRGVFCFQRKVLAESNYDLFNFMIRSIERARRIARNAAYITGTGINEPQGWLTANIFDRIDTPNATFNHQDFRRFLMTAPVEYGPVVATMHQNMFAYLAAQLDANSRFIFGDGDITYSPDQASERIRISNCLPDATENNSRGSTSNPFAAGAFIAAAGNWEIAYRAVTKAPLTMEQFEGGSTKWCVKYQFGAEDGGFVQCPQAARILQAGT